MPGSPRRLQSPLTILYQSLTLTIELGFYSGDWSKSFKFQIQIPSVLIQKFSPEVQNWRIGQFRCIRLPNDGNDFPCEPTEEDEEKEEEEEIATSFLHFYKVKKCAGARTRPRATWATPLGRDLLSISHVLWLEHDGETIWAPWENKWQK